MNKGKLLFMDHFDYTLLMRFIATHYETFEEFCPNKLVAKNIYEGLKHGAGHGLTTRDSVTLQEGRRDLVAEHPSGEEEAEDIFQELQKRARLG